MSEAEVRALIEIYFPADQVDLAVLVVRCESVFDAAAMNQNGRYGGLFQHSISAWDGRAAAAGFPGEPWWHAEANVAAAWNLWKGAPPYDASWHWPNCHAWAEDQLGG